MMSGEKPSPEALAKVHDALVLLENTFDGHFFAVGNRLTIADFSLVVSIAIIVASGISLLKYNNIKNWYARCQGQMQGFDEIVTKNMEMAGKMLKPKLRMMWIMNDFSVYRKIISGNGIWITQDWTH